MITARLALGLALAAHPQATPAPSAPVAAGGSCVLEPKFRAELEKRFGSSRVLTKADLYEDEREMYAKDHGSACPGTARGKFFGATERPAIALLLMGVGANAQVKLVVARPATTSWVFFEVEDLEKGSTAVLWKEGPGVYDGHNRKLSTKNDVIALTGYESWQRLFIWTGTKFEFVQTSD